MPNPQQQDDPQVPVQAKLTAIELEEVAKLTRRPENDWLEFPPEDIQMIWEAFPDGTTTQILTHDLRYADFKRFVRMCSAKRLDPLLNDLMWTYRADQRSPTKMKGTPMVLHGGELKIAHRNGLDGINQEFGQDEYGGIYCLTTVFKRGCQHPFIFKAYHNEYSKIGGHTWGSMPRLMLAKCSRVGDLRIAFPEELSGLMTEEEMQQQETRESNHAPTPATPAYSIGEIPATAPTATASPTPESGSSVEFAQAAKARAEVQTASTLTSGSGRPPELDKPASVEPTATATTTTAAASDDEAAKADIKKWTLVLLTGDYGKAGLTKAILDKFFLGYFGVERKTQQPLDPKLYPPILEGLALKLGAVPEALKTLIADPVDFGRQSKAQITPIAPEAPTSLYQDLKAKFKWGDGLCYTAMKLMDRAGFQSAADLEAAVLLYIGYNTLTEPQIEMLLTLAFYDAAACADVLHCYQQTKTPLSALEKDIETRLGAKLNTFQADPAKVIDAVTAAVAAVTKPGTAGAKA